MFNCAECGYDDFKAVHYGEGGCRRGWKCNNCGMVYDGSYFEEVQQPVSKFTDEDYLHFKFVNRNCNNLINGPVDNNVNAVAKAGDQKKESKRGWFSRINRWI